MRQSLAKLDVIPHCVPHCRNDESTLPPAPTKQGDGKKHESQARRFGGQLEDRAGAAGGAFGGVGDDINFAVVVLAESFEVVVEGEAAVVELVDLAGGEVGIQDAAIGGAGLGEVAEHVFSVERRDERPAIDEPADDGGAIDVIVFGQRIGQASGRAGRVGRIDGARPAAGARGAIEKKRPFLGGPAKVSARRDFIYFLDRVLSDIAGNEVAVEFIETPAERIAKAVGVNFLDRPGGAHEGIVGRNVVLMIGAVPRGPA